MSPYNPPNGGVFVIQFCDIDGRNAPNFLGGGSEFFLSGLQVSGRLGWGRSFDATAYDDWITTVIASKNEWRDGNARFRRSQQMGRRGLTAPAARWLVDGSVPARSERRVAAGGHCGSRPGGRGLPVAVGHRRFQGISPIGVNLHVKDSARRFLSG